MVRRPGLTRHRRSYGSERLCQDEFSGTSDIIKGEFSLGSSDRGGGIRIAPVLQLLCGDRLFGVADPIGIKVDGARRDRV